MVRLCFGRRDQSNDQTDDTIHDLSSGNATRFSYGSLRLATNNFSDNMMIGRGGFGEVYKGVLPDGTVVAVKNFDRAGSYNGTEGAFAANIFASRIRHRNVMKLVGYCIEKKHRLLVSEYVDNGSLSDLLHNQEKKGSVFNWPMRVAVCTGIARGLTYVHEGVNPPAVHRDIKPANILLDTNFTPKITDFDLVRFFPDSDELLLEVAVATRSDDFNSDSGLTTRVVGTLGYVDPEYFQSGRVTQKTDVYSFGVTMLEIISGRRPFQISSYDEHLLVWASNLLRDGRVLEIIDPVLSDFPTDVVKHFIEVAFLCIKTESKQRPSMREVIQMLDGACNSFGRQLLTCYSPHYFSAASSFRTSFTEGENEFSDSYTELQAQPEIEGAETSAAQSNAATVLQALAHQQQLGIVLSGTGDLVERLSQTMVFKKSPKLDFPEAVYPPFPTSVFRRGCSRHLYAFRYSSNTYC